MFKNTLLAHSIFIISSFFLWYLNTEKMVIACDWSKGKILRELWKWMLNYKKNDCLVHRWLLSKYKLLFARRSEVYLGILSLNPSLSLSSKRFFDVPNATITFANSFHFDFRFSIWIVNLLIFFVISVQDLGIRLPSYWFLKKEIQVHSIMTIILILTPWPKNKMCLGENRF